MANSKRTSPRAYSTRDKVSVLLQTRTQAQVAAMLGVSTRTIRRWKNEGVEPLRKTVAQTLTKTATKERAKLFKQGALHTHIPAPVMRRNLKERIDGKATGRIVSSPWLNHDVRRLDMRGKFEALRAIRDSGQLAQIIFKIGFGPRKGAQSGTAVMDLSGHSDSDLWELLIEIMNRYKEQQESDDEESDEESDEATNEILYLGALSQQ